MVKYPATVAAGLLNGCFKETESFENRESWIPTLQETKDLPLHLHRIYHDVSATRPLRLEFLKLRGGDT